jgi:hypothetical protein
MLSISTEAENSDTASQKPGRCVSMGARSGAARALVPCGLFLLVFAALALSGPGRIDIIDGQARFLVARSLVEHGDPAIRDADFWFTVLPGRQGQRYSNYRFPHSLAGVPAILLADAVGPPNEARREFFFSMIGAVLGGALAVIYALWFRVQGHGSAPAVGWGLAGIFCTPNWYYATSTFDDLLGTLFVVAAIALVWRGRTRQPLVAAALAGLALGLAVNAKQPLGVFLLPVLAVTLTAHASWRMRLGSAGLVVVGLGLGAAVYEGYEWYKFPPGTTDDHARLLAAYLQPWPGDTLAGLSGLLFSPAASVFLYCPPVLLGLAGLARWRRAEPVFVAALALACAIFLVFISTMTFFKGDPCWGPRYLTPILGTLWMFAPSAAVVWPRRLTCLLLGLGVIVQLLGLSADPFRLYVDLRLHSSFYAGNEWVHFHPAVSHLFNRPREIVEIIEDDGADTTAFGPASRPTSAPPVLEHMEGGADAVRKYRFLASFRPWWISQQWLAPADRPVALLPTGGALLALAAIGAGLLVLGMRSCGRLRGV